MHLILKIWWHQYFNPIFHLWIPALLATERRDGPRISDDGWRLQHSRHGTAPFGRRWQRLGAALVFIRHN